MYGELKKHLGEVFHRLAQQKESQILEGHLMADHVHMLMSTPPKCAVAQVVEFTLGKSAIHLARVYAGRKRSFVGRPFWARGYFVSTVGRDEAVSERRQLRCELIVRHGSSAPRGNQLTTTHALAIACELSEKLGART